MTLPSVLETMDRILVGLQQDSTQERSQNTTMEDKTAVAVTTRPVFFFDIDNCVSIIPYVKVDF